MINLLLLTFIFAFLMDRLVEFAARRIPLNRRLLVLLMYSLIVGLLTFGLVKYLPIITIEIGQLIKRITAFYAQPHDNVFMNYIEKVISSDQINAYLENGVSFLLKSFSDISKTSIDVFISLILSLFFLLEKPRLQEFTKNLKIVKLLLFIMKLNFSEKSSHVPLEK